jgi:hypothetical protein
MLKIMLIPTPPPGRPDPRTLALFKRNALQLGPNPGEVEPHDQVEIAHRASTPAPPAAASPAKGDSAEALERERNKKTYRKPNYPHPQAPPPRVGTQGWLLSKPSGQPKSREMREDELALYSRHHQVADETEAEEEEPEDPEPQEEGLTELDPQLARWLNGLLEDRPGTPGRDRLALLLARFGLGILRICQRHGVRVRLVDQGTTAFDRENIRVNVLRADLASQKARVYEAFSQSYDLALGRGREASLDSLAVLTNFHQARAKNPELTSPPHYFAQIMADFLAGHTGTSMHGYVDYLLQQSGQEV